MKRQLSSELILSKISICEILFVSIDNFLWNFSSLRELWIIISQKASMKLFLSIARIYSSLSLNYCSYNNNLYVGLKYFVKYLDVSIYPYLINSKNNYSDSI